MTPRQLYNGEPERFDYAAGICSGGCTDLDMVWERRGRFLLIENKQPGETIPKGQLITLRELERQGWTVWVVTGRPPDDIISAGLLDGPQHPMGVQQLRLRIQRWWDETTIQAAA